MFSTFASLYPELLPLKSFPDDYSSYNETVMAYEVYITKKENWFDSDASMSISIEEWSSFVKNDPEMRLDNFSEVGLESGEIFRYDNPGAAVWINPRTKEGEDKVIHFDFLSGNISVSSPSEAVIEKMRHIAFKLGAKVQGEEGELYENTEAWPEPEVSTVSYASLSQKLKSRWAKLFNSVFAFAGRRND